MVIYKVDRVGRDREYLKIIIAVTLLMMWHLEFSPTLQLYLFIPWTFTVNDTQDEKKKGRNTSIILEDKFTFQSQCHNWIKVWWCYGYLIMLKAELEFNIFPHTERTSWCFILKRCFEWAMQCIDTPSMRLLKTLWKTMNCLNCISFLLQRINSHNSLKVI